MSVVAVRVFEDKIVIWSDQQITYWDDMKNEHNKPIKLHKCWDFVFWSCWSLSEAYKMKMFLDEYEPKTVKSCKDILNLLNQFKERWSAYWVLSVENIYIFVTNWKVFQYTDYVDEVTNYTAIWSWAVKAIVAMELCYDLETVLKLVCKHDLYCSEPLVMITIPK